MKERFDISPLFSLFDDLDRKIEKYDFIPSDDIIKTDKGFKVRIYLPDIEKEDINIEYEEYKLIVSGERKLDKDLNFIVKRNPFGKFRRAYDIPKDIDLKKIDAELKNGVLEIEMVKDEEKVNAKQIAIK